MLQSPKDAPLEFFQDSTRPLSARMSDKPGGAFSGLRPTSFSRGNRPARSRVSSITEEEQTGEQPLVSQSYSGGFGRSESSIGGDKGSGGGDRPIASRRIAGSRSGDREGRGRSSRTDKDGRRRRSSRSRSTSRGGGGKGAAASARSRASASASASASSAVAGSSAVVSAGDGTDGSGSGGRSGSSGGGKSGRKSRTNSGFGDLSGGDTGDEAPPANRTQTMYRNHNQHGSVGTALHAIDRVQTISAAKSQKPGAAAAVAAAKVTISKTPNRRRASHSGPVGTDRRVSPTANGEPVDTAAHDSSGGGGGGTMLPRRTSTGQLHTLVSMGSNFESVTTIGTPGVTQDSSISRGLSRAAGPRGNGAFSRSRYAVSMLEV